MSICCFCFWQKAQTFQKDCSNVIFSSHQKVIIPNSSLLLAWKWTSFVLKGRSFIISQRLWQWLFTFFSLNNNIPWCREHDFDIQDSGCQSAKAPTLKISCRRSTPAKHNGVKDVLNSHLDIYVKTILRDSNLYRLLYSYELWLMLLTRKSIFCQKVTVNKDQKHPS